MCSISVEPMPSRISTPVRSVQRLPSPSGSASPAEVQILSFNCHSLGKGRASEKRGIERGNAVENRRLLLHQALEHGLRRRALGHEDGRRADRHREGERIAQPIGEEKLRRRKHHVRFANAENRLRVELGRRNQVRMQVHRALGRPGRAGRVEPEADVVARRRRRFGLGRRLGESLFQFGMSNDVAKIGALQGLEVLEQRLGDEKRAGAAVAKLVLVVLRREQRVHRHRDDAGLDGAEEERHPVGAVEHRDADALLAPDVHGAQHIGYAVDALGELGVGAAAAVVDIGDLAGTPGAQIAVDEVDRGVVVARQLDRHS